MKTVIVALAGLLTLGVAVPVASAASAERVYYIAPFELREVYGTYPLSDGDVLRVGPANAGTRAWAALRGSGRIALVPIGPLEFVSGDGRLYLRFEALPFTTEVTVERAGASRVQGELGK